MKRSMGRIFLIGLVVWFVHVAACYAGTGSGNVFRVSPKGVAACDVIPGLIPGYEGQDCVATAETQAVVGILGTLPRNVEAGRAVILHPKKGGKIIARVVGIVDLETPLGEVARQLLEEKANVVWLNEESGPALLLRSEDDVGLEVGDEVQLKVRQAKGKRIEGC